MHGWFPKAPLNTVEIARLSKEDLAELATTEASPSGDEEKANNQGLTHRLGQIDVMCPTSRTARDNMQAAQKSQKPRKFNSRRGIPEDATVAQPASLFTPVCLVLIREFNPNHILIPGEKAGASRLRGTERGPFKYGGPSPTGKRYRAVEDQVGNVWDRHSMT